MVNRLFLLFVIVVVPSLVWAQCIADAGDDKIICVGLFGVDTTQIGGNLAGGGMPPYTYSWQVNHTVTVGGSTFSSSASDFLDDSTLAQPKIVSQATAENESIAFVLTVSDFNGAVCRDTVNIRFSSFIYGLSYISYSITLGDSVWLDHGSNISGGIPPYTYLWTPNHGLSDSLSMSFWAQPDSSIHYSLWLTDSAGCRAFDADYYRITVGYLGDADLESGTGFNVYPNPAGDYLHIENPFAEIGFVRMLDMQGRVMRDSMRIPGMALTSLDLADLPAGVYLLELSFSSGRTFTRKIRKQ